MLKITDLRKQYGKVTALDGVDLQVNQGETVVVMYLRLRQVNFDPLYQPFNRTGRRLYPICWCGCTAIGKRRAAGFEKEYRLCLSAVQSD